MPDRATGDAPGRVNLIGEHTDYHEGFVLPTVIPQRTRVQLTRGDGTRVRVWSSAYRDEIQTYDIGGERPGHTWLDYVQGVTAMLRRAEVAVPGFDAHIESDIPVGSGVSSSAALTVSLLRGLRALLGLTIDDVDVAKIAQKVETDFVGAPVGIMDQMVCSLGRPGAALFLDTRTLAFEEVPIPESMTIAVIDSGVSHQHSTGGYIERRRESFEAAARLAVGHLRDLGLGDLDRINALPTPLAQRARHIVTENARVLAAVDALRVNDPVTLGRLLNESHASLRDDYQVSHPDVDLLVSIATHQPECYGARMTGGGFGGAVVLLMKAGSRSTAHGICEEYRRRTQRNGAVLVA